jgi:hypothetical protein
MHHLSFSIIMPLYFEAESKTFVTTNRTLCCFFSVFLRASFAKQIHVVVDCLCKSSWLWQVNVIAGLIALLD